MLCVCKRRVLTLGQMQGNLKCELCQADKAAEDKKHAEDFHKLYDIKDERQSKLQSGGY
jgi:hypothetical protein